MDFVYVTIYGDFVVVNINGTNCGFGSGNNVSPYKGKETRFGELTTNGGIACLEFKFRRGVLDAQGMLNAYNNGQNFSKPVSGGFYASKSIFAQAAGLLRIGGVKLIGVNAPFVLLSWDGKDLAKYCDSIAEACISVREMQSGWELVN